MSNNGKAPGSSPGALSGASTESPAKPFSDMMQNTKHVKRRKHKVFRNPVIQAREMALAMELEGLSRADLARRIGCSRARVTQKLNLLNLTRDLLLEIESMGD